METRAIGSLDVSLVGLGCNNFGMRCDEERSDAVVHAALDSGITFFDTADVYGGTRSEEFLGRALAGRRGGARLGGPPDPVPPARPPPLGEVPPRLRAQRAVLPPLLPAGQRVAHGKVPAHPGAPRRPPPGLAARRPRRQCPLG